MVRRIGVLVALIVVAVAVVRVLGALVGGDESVAGADGTSDATSDAMSPG